ILSKRWGTSRNRNYDVHSMSTQEPASHSLLESAIRHHQAGRLPEAESVYRRILAQNSNHAVALSLLGLLAHQTGNTGAAVGLVERAIQLDPSVADFYERAA